MWCCLYTSRHHLSSMTMLRGRCEAVLSTWICLLALLLIPGLHITAGKQHTTAGKETAPAKSDDSSPSSLSELQPRSSAQTSVVYEHEDYCETESFNATCDAGEVVFITHARYGRMQISRCVKLDYGHVGCASDVTAIADTRCSGRRHCQIRIPDNWFAKTKPCPDDLKPFLEVGYSCLKVHSVDALCSSPGPILLSSAEGYLASLITETTGCGGMYNPWVINAKPGQIIHITLYDFSVAIRKEGGESSSTFPHCQMYAMIREKLASGATRNITVCGGLVREKTVYTSTGPSVEVTIMKVAKVHFKIPGVEDALTGGGKTHFILKYEVSGCSDVHHPIHSWAVRNDDGMTLKCNFSSEVFHLKCVGSQWVGEMGNCSKAPLLKHSKIEFEEIHIPYGMSIMIVIVIALVIGLFVLTIGLLFLKKQKGLCQPRRPPEEDIYGQRDDGDSMGEKEYVRAPWQTQGSQGSMGSVKNVQTWPRENDYPAFGTELPPCTPLMDRFHKPPLYGQLGSKLPCGCPTYMTRSEVIQQQQQGEGHSGDSPQHRAAGQVSVNPSNPDHVQYFLVEPDMLAGSERNSQVVTSQSTLPRGPTPHVAAQNSSPGATSTFKPPAQQQQPQPRRQQPNNNNHQQQQQSNNHSQTDEIKLRMRKTDTGPVAPGTTAQPATVHESYKAICNKDRLENASNDRLECINTRDCNKDTEL